MADSIFPFPHYNYEELEDTDSLCNCSLCRGYRAALKLSAEAVGSTSGHKFRCKCTHCSRRKASERSLLVASNRRDTYSELSWISRTFSWRSRFLTWAWSRIADDTWQTPYYWTHEAERKTLGSWLESWLEDDVSVNRLISSERLLRGESV